MGKRPQLKWVNGQMSPKKIGQWANVPTENQSMGKRPHGQMGHWANRSMGKRPHGQIGQWANVIMGK